MNPEVMNFWEEMSVEELVRHQQDYGVNGHQRLAKRISMPPENELMKGTERQLSEAELRVRRSLQRLDVPDWMKNAPPPQQGFLLRRRDYGSNTGTGGGWSAYSSKTASMTSLGSSRAHTPNTPTKVVIPTRVATRGVGGLGGIVSPASNSSISPSPSDRSGSLFHYPSSRWSTSRLNSGTTTPTGSVTSSRTTATCGRQPYLGWRSQTSLASLAGSQSSLTSSGSYLTAADRLALGITAYSQRFVKQQPQQTTAQDKENCAAEANSVESSEVRNQSEGGTNGIQLQVPPDVVDVHSSIKEVTSAIVHYCNESTPSPRASPRGSPRPEGRAPSPRRLVWVESSFVGSRPITSPETPTSSSLAITPTSQLNGHDLPEGGEVTPRPPQPPEVASLVNSLSSACSSLRDSSRDSTAASTNDSTAVIVDSSLGDSSRADSRHSLSDSGQSTVDRSTVGSRHSTADTVNSGLSSRNIDSLNSRSSVLSSAGCSSRGSVGSSSRSSSSRPGSSRDDMQASPGSDDLAPRQASGVFQEDGQQHTSPPSHHQHPAPTSYFSHLTGRSHPLEQEQEQEQEVEGEGEVEVELDEGRLWPAANEGTSLEDVLDSLLALPAASRSPSPVTTHTLGRPFSHTGATRGSPEERHGGLEGGAGAGAGAGEALHHYGHLGNHDVPSDYKTDGYHKSLSYSPVPPRPAPAPLLPARDEVSFSRGHLECSE
ncbi:hypothetical protein Pmani_027794 [Petrolisthes manimaculis]|uniref:Uncharacterized protein n=1 Tax=Petrolisthes manimaculis TaxID=1843537 RepID=A0AAE1TYP3_9EUCA|nr:hypothetical protein Pmani_027794 [Petrolisthes manimaculis]